MLVSLIILAIVISSGSLTFLHWSGDNSSSEVLHDLRKTLWMTDDVLDDE